MEPKLPVFLNRSELELETKKLNRTLVIPYPSTSELLFNENDVSDAYKDEISGEIEESGD